MFTGRTLAIVVVTYDDPFDTVVTVVGSGLGNTTILARNLVLDFVGFAVLSVDGTDEAVLGDVLQMSTVLQPGATSGNVISRTFALGLDQDRKVGRCLAVPRLERLEELETVRLGVDRDLDADTVLRRGLEGVLSGIIATGRELIAAGVRELEGFPITADKLVGEGVETETASKSESSDNVRGCNESMSGRVSIVTTSKVTVVGGDDCRNDQASIWNMNNGYLLEFTSPFLTSCLSH